MEQVAYWLGGVIVGFVAGAWVMFKHFDKPDDALQQTSLAAAVRGKWGQ